MTPDTRTLVRAHHDLATALLARCAQLREWALNANTTKFVVTRPQDAAMMVSSTTLDTEDRAKLMRLSRRFEILGNEMKETHAKLAVIRDLLHDEGGAEVGRVLNRCVEQEAKRP